MDILVISVLILMVICGIIIFQVVDKNEVSIKKMEDNKYTVQIYDNGVLKVNKKFTKKSLINKLGA